MQLNPALLIFLGVILAVIAWSWWRSAETAGLPLAYVLSLAMMHWLGAFIHTLPWYEGGDNAFVVLGFQQCTYGVMAFGAGAILLAPWLLSKVPVESRRVQPAPPRQLPTIFIVTGVLFYTVLGTLLKKIPSFSALAACGVYLVIVGLALRCWQAWRQGRRETLFFWLLPVCALPFITTVTAGFMGYGVAAALMVFCFVFRFYRPRWQAALGMAAILFLGVSLGVNYFRERVEIRDAVWNEEKYTERITRIAQIFTTFEFFNVNNADHLASIEERLNQNDLVGRAVVNLATGGVDYAKGETFWEAAIAIVPRIFWPNKPVQAGSGDLVTKYTGMTFAEGTSVGIGQIMEFYINFGTAGVVGGSLVIGCLLGLVDGMAARKLKRGDSAGFATWFLPGLGLLQTGGSLSEVSGTVAASVVLMAVMNRFILPLYASRQPRPAARRKTGPPKNAAREPAPKPDAARR